ncbi:hypothetical protein HU200_001385 [Digitaria exilis]|uniref:Uncharacterized protein n=1 Tax=Digitaria exilis TaxID=1010633 RepID=A0A835FXC9_9POAL|nr:hypothetical protein HU200_001385 [Digitaria exilis]
MMALLCRKLRCQPAGNKGHRTMRLINRIAAHHAVAVELLHKSPAQTAVVASLPRFGLLGGVRGRTPAPPHSSSSPNLKQTGSVHPRRPPPGETKGEAAARGDWSSECGQRGRWGVEWVGQRRKRRAGGRRRRNMSSLGTSKGILEIAKFGVYVSVPVALTYLVATDSKTLKKLMGLVSAF